MSCLTASLKGPHARSSSRRHAAMRDLRIRRRLANGNDVRVVRWKPVIRTLDQSRKSWRNHPRAGARRCRSERRRAPDLRVIADDPTWRRLQVRRAEHMILPARFGPRGTRLGVNRGGTPACSFRLSCSPSMTSARASARSGSACSPSRVSTAAAAPRKTRTSPPPPAELDGTSVESPDVTCSSDQSCATGESCNGGVCQLPRCSEPPNPAAPPLGNVYHLRPVQQLLAADSSTSVRGFAGTALSAITNGSWSAAGTPAAITGGSFLGTHEDALAVAVAGSTQINVIPATATGTPVTLAPSFSPLAIAAGDTDGDGVDDVVALGQGGQIAFCHISTQACDETTMANSTGIDPRRRQRDRQCRGGGGAAHQDRRELCAHGLQRGSCRQTHSAHAAERPLARRGGGHRWRRDCRDRRPRERQAAHLPRGW